MQLVLLSLALLGLFSKVHGNCQNACSGHGRCNSKDACECDYKWTGNDCSQRMCQFHKAHVDSGAGDINGDGTISGTGTLIGPGSDPFMYGTTEQYTVVTDSDGTTVPNMGHGPAECSNKGTCDRKSGECVCFDGFTGSGCQVMECPNRCSGHGVCTSKKKIAESYYGSMYSMWDKDSTMGCQCDAGYSGPDCSMRHCPVGVDPLYSSGSYKNPSRNNYTFEFYTVGSEKGYIEGNYSLIFEDMQGRSYETAVLDIRSSCAEIRSAIQALPNKFLTGRISCHRSTRSRGYLTNSTGSADLGFRSYNNQFTSLGKGQEQYKVDFDGNAYGGQNIAANQEVIIDDRFLFERYTLVFDDEDKQIKSPTINIYHNGKQRPSLQAFPKDETLSYKVYRNGFKADTHDYFFEKCDGVTVSLGTTVESTHKFTELEGLSAGAETKLFKQCLGDADGDLSTNMEVENWDYGSVLHPHVIVLNEVSNYGPWLYNDDFHAKEYNIVNGGTTFDRTAIKEPVTRLCDGISKEYARYGGSIVPETSTKNVTDAFCSNAAPASFMVVMYYHYVSSATDGKWAIFNNAYKNFNLLDNGDYTFFSVYTTPSWLSLVSSDGLAITHRPLNYNNPVISGDKERLDFTSTIHTTTDLQCENMVPDGSTNFECINVGDEFIMMTMPKYDAGGSVTTNYAVSSPDSNHRVDNCNPIYLNMYTVMRAWIQPLTTDSPMGESSPGIDSIENRTYITLDAGTNSIHDYGCATYIYKFMKNTTIYPEGGPKYRGECSMRGDCDYETGLCDCDPGFTGHSCGVQSALAM